MTSSRPLVNCDSIECEFDPMLSDTYYIVENGVAVKSDLTKRPKYPFTKLNRGAMTWEDARTPEEVSSDTKDTRNQLLEKSDWTQLPDVPIATKEAWAVYRQALRDITEQPGYPLDVVWPEPPSTAP